MDTIFHKFRQKNIVSEGVKSFLYPRKRLHLHYAGQSIDRGYILVPRTYDPSGLRQESRALGATILK